MQFSVYLGYLFIYHLHKITKQVPTDIVAKTFSGELPFLIKTIETFAPYNYHQ